MAALDQAAIEQLLRDPVFRVVGAEDKARLLSNVSTRGLAIGETLIDQSSSPAHVFLIKSGELNLELNQATCARKSGFLGAELLLGAQHYTSTVTAAQPSVVYMIPVRALAGLVAEYAALKATLFESYALPHRPIEAGDSAPTPVLETQSLNRQIAGWLVAIVVPLLVWKFCDGAELSKEAVYFLAIVSSAIAMWMFDLVPAFLPPLFSVLATILFDIVPPQVAVAGFSSNGFFMLLSIFAIGALMVMSGLTYRISLHILKWVPANQFWYNISLFMYGLILTPLIPSQLGRTTIVMPFLSTLIDTAGGKKNDPAVAQFIVSAMAGVALAASIFLTGKPANLIIFGLFDSQTQFAFAWLQWFYAASFTGAMLVLLYLLIACFLFKTKEQFGIPKHVVASQLQTLGPLGRNEWGAMLAIGLLIAGILSASLHKVEIAWLSVTILVTLLLFGAIQKDDISKRVDWSILIFIASIVAWVPIMRQTGLDRLVFGSLSWVGIYMKTEVPLFVLALSFAIIVIRLALPEMVTEILLVTLLLPLANLAGVSPWLIGFIILTMCETYIFPYQAPYHIQLKNQLAALGQDALYDEKKVVCFNIVLTLARVVALYASLPFWKTMNIL